MKNIFVFVLVLFVLQVTDFKTCSQYFNKLVHLFYIWKRQFTIESTEAEQYDYITPIPTTTRPTCGPQPSCRPCNGKQSYYTDKNGCGKCRRCSDSF